MTTIVSFVPTTYTAPNIPLEAPTMPVEQSLDESGIKSRIHYYAEKYNVSEITMNIAIKCESNYNPNAVGDNGNSFGLVQIYLPAHPNITKEQALDVEFALDFMAKNLKEGRHRMWTCLHNN